MYKTKIRINDAYEITEQTGSGEQPYISNVLLTEATAVGTPSIGGSAANTLSLRIYNSPVTSLEGVKIELFAQEVVGDTIDIEVGTISFDEPQGEANDPVDDAILREFGISSIEDIDNAEGAEFYDMGEATIQGPLLTVDDSNDNYRSTDGTAPTTIADEVPDNGDEDWTPMGVFFAQSVSVNDTYTGVVAYDNFINMNAKFTPTVSTATISELYEDFRSKLYDMGIEAEEEDEFPDVTITWTADASFRESAGYFASFMGAYANFNRYGVLDLVKYLKNDTYMITDGDVLSYNSSIDGGINVSGVACNTGGDNWLVTPLGQERGADVIECENPMMTQAILDTTLETYQFLVFQPCELTVNWQPTIKAGDLVEVQRGDDTIWGCIHNLEIDFTQGKAKIVSLGDPDAVSKYQSPTVRKLIEAGKTATNYITEDETGALVIRRDTDNFSVRIDADSVDIMQGDDVIARYGEEIEIGGEYPLIIKQDGVYLPNTAGMKIADNNGVYRDIGNMAIFSKTFITYDADNNVIGKAVCSIMSDGTLDIYGSRKETDASMSHSTFGGFYSFDANIALWGIFNYLHNLGFADYDELSKTGNTFVEVHTSGNTGAGYVTAWRSYISRTVSTTDNAYLSTRLVSTSANHAGVVTLSYHVRIGDNIGR